VYIPKNYRVEDRATILEFLRANEFAAIVSYDGGQIVATHTPVEVIEGHTGEISIYGHMSRANAQWKTFGSQEVMLIFQGPHTYISPRWYNHVNVPTWNYMIAHVYGAGRLLEEGEFKTFLSSLVRTHEVNTGYSFEGLPEDFVQKEMKGIVGFGVAVSRMEAAYKLSQNRNDEDHATVVRELKKREDDDSQRVAAAMHEQRETAKRRG
jgi:transcriptional regulator